jgi:thiamine-phosphate diphosphorylase / hydroxyethylthiazole kinase
MTGSTDYLSDGERTVAIGNGSHWLGKITGSGCALGSVIAGYVAVHRQDKFLAALAGILHYEIAAERAQEQCRGPGSFIPAFLDELYLLGQQIKQGDIVMQQKDLKLEWI